MTAASTALGWVGTKVVAPVAAAASARRLVMPASRLCFG
jgi:hypothetical protein